ncbi:hypothetical protein PIROE2DRAFT_8614 [Piromyces sp. E2]|nr:hypothetical protein PIROE2DRAFT_8614 [Piromyces sp. E2]|eukprot:OUM64543.1 hypothetical protein PIROE2DRAFT_8614 [Piromyces sp. E2]
MAKKSKGFCNVVTTKLSHESLMLSFNEFLTSEPLHRITYDRDGSSKKSPTTLHKWNMRHR